MHKQVGGVELLMQLNIEQMASSKLVSSGVELMNRERYMASVVDSLVFNEGPVKIKIVRITRTRILSLCLV